MNFSFDFSGAMLTGNINPQAMVRLGALFGGVMMVRMIIYLAILALMIVSRWRVFKKAGLPGRGIFVPFYNLYLIFKVGGRSGWNFLWILFPPVFIVLVIINLFKITKRFGKHRTFGLGLLFIKIVFVPILAFDDSKYMGKKIIAKKVEAKVVIKPVAKAPIKKVIKKAPAKKVIKKVKILK